MAKIIQDEGPLQLHLNIDLARLCVMGMIDTAILCIIALIDTANLCTDLGTSTGIFYRADTTLLTADITSITADYQH